MKIFSLSILTCCLISSLSFADSGPDQRAPMPTPPAPEQQAPTTLDFDSLRAACLNPAKFHNQIAPKNIQVSCQDVQTKWVPDADGSVHMSGQRTVTVSVASDKYTADAFSGPVVVADKVVSCPQYKQITETVEVVHPTTCDELVAFCGSAVDFCVGNVNSMRASNPSAVTTQATGQVMSLCTASTQQDRR